MRRFNLADPLYREWQTSIIQTSEDAENGALEADYHLMGYIVQRYPTDINHRPAYLPFDFAAGSTYPTTACMLSDAHARDGEPGREYLTGELPPAYPLNLLYLASTSWPWLQGIEKARLLEVLTGWVCTVSKIPRTVDLLDLAGEISCLLASEPVPNYFQEISVNSLSDCLSAQDSARQICETMFPWCKSWAHHAVAPLLKNRTFEEEISSLQCENQLKLFNLFGSNSWEKSPYDVLQLKQELERRTSRWTLHERRVMELLGDGLSYFEIAQSLGMTVWDVKKHLQNARRLARADGTKAQRARQKK